MAGNHWGHMVPVNSLWSWGLEGTASWDWNLCSILSKLHGNKSTPIYVEIETNDPDIHSLASRILSPSSASLYWCGGDWKAIEFAAEDGVWGDRGKTAIAYGSRICGSGEDAHIFSWTLKQNCWGQCGSSVEMLWSCYASSVWILHCWCGYLNYRIPLTLVLPRLHTLICDCSAPVFIYNADHSKSRCKGLRVS